MLYILILFIWKFVFTFLFFHAANIYWVITYKGKRCQQVKEMDSLPLWNRVQWEDRRWTHFPVMRGVCGNNVIGSKGPRGLSSKEFAWQNTFFSHFLALPSHQHTNALANITVIFTNLESLHRNRNNENTFTIFTQHLANFSTVLIHLTREAIKFNQISEPH